MNLSDIIIHTKSILPLFTDLLSIKSPITTITKSNDVVTVTCPSHGLSVSDEVIVSNVKTDITISSITSSNGIATAICSSPHDLSYGYVKTISISSDEPAYNGDFLLLSVPSDTKFMFRVGSSAGDSTGVLHTFHNIGFNGVQSVTEVVDANTFKYELENDFLQSGSGDSMHIVKSLNIAGSSSIERAEEFYTVMTPNQYYMFICLETANASNSRFINGDSSNELFSSQDFYVKMVNTLSAYLFIPTKNDMTGSDAVDKALEFLPNLYKVLAGYNPPSLFSNSTSSLMMPLSHGIGVSNDAYMIYRYEFEITESVRGAQDIRNVANTDKFMYNLGDSYDQIRTVSFNKFSLSSLNNNDIVTKNDQFNID